MSAGQKTLRSLGMTVMFTTGVLLTGLAFTYIAGEWDSTWRRLALSAGLVGGAVASFAMTVDAADFWVLGRRMTAFSVRMTRSLVFVAVLAALGLSMVASGPAVLLTMTPAMLIYLFGVFRGRTDPVRRPDFSEGRQRRGGRKRA